MAGITNDILSADNVNFSGDNPTIGEVTTDGELLIGSTAFPNIKVGTLTSPNSTITIGYSDPNITLDLAGGQEAIDSIAVDTGTSPIVPNASGLVNINGTTVSAGTNPVRTDGTASNTMAIEVQISQAIASADSTKIGLSNFDSAYFSVDADGFVSTSGTGLGETITGDTGGALSPTAGNWNILGSHGLNTSGSGSTLTAAIDNAITLGDLSAIGAGSNALSATTGDINITAGNLKLPNTTSADSGVININSERFIHQYGSTTNAFCGRRSGNFTLTSTSSTALGFETLISSTSGSNNTAIGTYALTLLTTGGNNVAIGSGALKNNNGSANIAIGLNAMIGSPTSTATNNIMIGQTAGQSLTSGTANTSLGINTCLSLTTGINNNCIGQQTLTSLITGRDNVAIGFQTGLNYTTSESYNILINNSGTVGESNVCRIGSATGTGVRQINSTYIHGITGNTQDQSATVKAVTINTSTSQLGVSTLNGVFDWTDENASFNAEAQEGYFVTDTATASLPASPSQGDTVSFALDTANVLTIQASGSQVIRVGSSVSSAAGTAVSTAQGDSITLVYRASSTSWIATSVIGTFTLT